MSLREVTTVLARLRAHLASFTESEQASAALEPVRNRIANYEIIEARLGFHG